MTTEKPDVNRWHCHPNERLRNSGDTINWHQERVAKTVWLWATMIDLDPDSREYLRNVALVHDKAERVLGDMPAPAKARFPALAAEYAKAEAEVMREMGLVFDLTKTEADILHLADKMDAFIWAREYGEVAHEAENLQAMADALGLGEVVAEVLK